MKTALITGAKKRDRTRNCAPGEFAKATDHLDVLVNNAGILLDGGSALLSGSY